MRSWRAAGAVVAALFAAGTGWAEPARLAGVVVAGDDRVAVFAIGPGRPWLALREGDRLDDELVVAITARSVLLRGPDGSRSIVIGDDPAMRTTLMSLVPPPAPHVDPYRREREVENDQ